MIREPDLDQSAYSIALKDRHGTYVYTNNTVEKYFGSAQNALLGKTDYHFQPDQDAALLRLNDRQVMTTGHAVRAIEFASLPNGRQGVWFVQKFLVRANSESFLAVVGLDITGDAEAKGLEVAAVEAETSFGDLTALKEQLTRIATRLTQQ